MAHHSFPQSIDDESQTHSNNLLETNFMLTEYSSYEKPFSERGMEKRSLYTK